jgi:MtrB/PioB family decaheme-associated outer membrane protein
LRQKTDEAGVRAELSRKFSDELSGSVGLSSSHRNGSSWLQPNPGATGVTAVTNFALGTVFMPTLADRQRDKVKLTADWQASEKVNFQFRAENGTDKFSAPTANGLRDSGMNQFGVDWSYALSDNWNVVGYLSQSNQTLNQSVYGGTVMAFENNSTGSSIGVTGKYSSKVNVGASLSYVDDRSAYAQSPDAAALPSVASQLALSGGLPDINYRQTAIKLYATYALEKKSSVRVDLMHQRTTVNDWTWGYNGVPFTYSDKSTVEQRQNQYVSFLGVTYVYQLP